MEYLEYSPRPGASATVKPRAKTVRFGDGYEQRQQDGLNPVLRVYQLTFRNSHDDTRELEAFLERHGAVKAFLWTPYDTQRQSTYVCREWTPTIHHHYTDISCTFEEVPA